MQRAPRVAVPLAAALLGFLAVLAASQPQRETRESRRLEIADLIAREDRRVRDLRAEVRALEEELTALSKDQGSVGGRASALAQEAEALTVRFGGAPVEGPGVVVTLDDSSAARSPTGDPNDLVVHERDLQTVVNALWASGAEAVAINGERLLATSAVRCAGNTLLLHGALHSPPYRIAAIGDPEAIRAALPDSPGMDRLLAAVRAFGIGYRVDTDSVRLGGRTVSPRLALARPVGEGA